MKGILKHSYDFVELNEGRRFDEDDIFSFEKGDEVEILKIIETNMYISGVALVCLNNENKESMTIDSELVDIIHEGTILVEPTERMTKEERAKFLQEALDSSKLFTKRG